MNFIENINMKTLLLFSALLFSANLCAQQQNQTNEINRYLQKSNNKRKTANVLLITGGALILTAIAVGNSGNQNGTWFFTTNQLVGGAIFPLGTLSAVASVPFYISAGNNRSKSRKISPEIGNFKTTENNYVTAGLKIQF